jgi:hypothetical protein
MLSRQIAASGRLATLRKEIADGKLKEIKHPIQKTISKPTPMLHA